MATHKHHGAEQVFEGERPRANSEMNITPMIDVLRYADIVQVIDAAKGAGVEKVGIVTEGMRRAAGAAPAPGTK
jgi:biopolymer transport protein ExbD